MPDVSEDFSGSMALVLRELLKNGVLNRNGDEKGGSTSLSLDLAPQSRGLDNQGIWRHSSDTVGLLHQEV